jgi:hypothetical protein
MAAIDARTPCFTAVSSLDLPEQRARPVLAMMVHRAEEHMRTSPGFVSASILRRRAQGSAPIVDGAPARLLEYVQWDSSTACSRFLEAGPDECHSGISQNAARSQSDTYELDAVISAAGRLDVITADSRLTLVVVMEPHAGKQKFINDYNQAETHDFFSKFDAFVGAAFHLAPSGRVLEYLQWESAQALESVNSTQRFRTHIETNARHCHTIDFGIYDVMRTIRVRETLPAAPAESR